MRRRAAGGLVLAFLAFGCGDPVPRQGTGDAPPAGHAEHVHSAPHGGLLVPCGEEFANVELLLDAKTGKLTAYTLGPHASQHVRLPDDVLRVDIMTGRDVMAFELAAVASELTGETLGDTSEFSVTDERLVGLDRFEGAIDDLTIRGRTFPSLPFSYPE